MKKYRIELWGGGTIFRDSVRVPEEVYRRCKKESFVLDVEEEIPLPDYLAKATGRTSSDPWDWQNAIEGAGLQVGSISIIDEKTGDTIADYPVESFTTNEVCCALEMPVAGYVPESPVLYYAEHVETAFYDAWSLVVKGDSTKGRDTGFDPKKLTFSVRKLLDGTREYLGAFYDGCELEAVADDPPGSFGDADSSSAFKWLLPRRKKRAKSKRL